MKLFNYLTLIVALFVMSFSYANEATSNDYLAEEEAPAEEAPAEEAPTEEAPAEEAPAEEAPAEEAPAEEEMPSASEDSEVSTDQPVKFKEEFLVTAQLGTSTPFGANLKNTFDAGSAIKINVATPFGFSLGKKELKVILGLDMLTMAAMDEWRDDYSVTNFTAKVATKLMMFDLQLGVGFGSASAYELTVPSFAGSLSYELPVSGLMTMASEQAGIPEIANLRVSAFFETMILTSSPLENGTSDLMNMGVSFSYPVLF